MVQEKITTFGNKNILGTHPTTIEITKDSKLTERGDCIIGVNANKACADLSEELKKELKSNNKFKIILRTGDLEEKISGFGSPNLILTHKTDIVLRKSDFIDDRTLLINCDKSCADLNREFIEKLKNQEQKLEFIIKL